MHIAIDIGGTKTRIALFESLENPVEKNRIELNTQNDYEKECVLIASSIKKLSNNPKAIGISITGELNEDKTGVKDSISLRSWQGKDFKNWLIQETDSEVVLDNDMVVAGLGEAVYGNHGLNDFLFVIWGTGLGGAYFKKTSNNWVSEQSEFGQQIIDWDKKTTLENVVAGRKAEELYGKKLEDLDDTQWNEVEKLFAMGLHNALCTKYSPNIIFGGGVAIKQQERLKNIEKEINDKFWKKVEFAPSSLGEDAGLLGALALIKLNLK